MYGNTDKTLWIKFYASLVLAVVLTIVMVISNITGAGFDITNVGDIFEQLALIVISPILMTIGVFGMLLNYANILKGIVTPIPIISMIIEYLKGFVMSIKAFVYLIKSKRAEAETEEE